MSPFRFRLRSPSQTSLRGRSLKHSHLQHRYAGFSVLAVLLVGLWSFPQQSWVNLLHALLPVQAHPLFTTPDGSAFAWGAVKQDYNARLLAAPRPGSWPLAELGAPNVTAGDHAAGQGVSAPALVMLHIFSQSTPAAARRRRLIREHSPLLTLPAAYRHLVDVRFVLGRPAHVWPEEQRHEADGVVGAEMAKYGDIIRLDNLKGGENMNEGKTLEWLEHVGREGGPPAWWVFKCDDDTLPLLPNLLPYLLQHDPQTPTYIGAPFCDKDLFLFQSGMMYGMSWGIVKSLAAAGFTDEEKHVYAGEDTQVGRLMLSLPSVPPDMTPIRHGRRTFYDTGTAAVPSAVQSAPNRRTGLVRLSLYKYFGDYRLPWTKGWSEAMAWHHLKTDESWLAAWDAAVDGYASVGRRFMWEPPDSMRHLAAR